MSQILTQDKARQLLKELQYAKAAMRGQLSVKEEYYKQALEIVVKFNTKRKIFTCTGCNHSLLDEAPSSCDCMEKDAIYIQSEALTECSPL